jgi:hypothetical protein
MGAGLEEEVGVEPAQPTAATAMQQSKARRNRFISCPLYTYYMPLGAENQE